MSGFDFGMHEKKRSDVDKKLPISVTTNGHHIHHIIVERVDN